MALSRAIVIVAVSATFLLSPLRASDWSRFRGPNGSGVSAATGLPVEMGAGKNQAWVAEVPFGRSSPVLTADRLFVTGMEEGKLVTLAVDRSSGETLWKRAVERSHDAELYEETDSATPTPVTDGTHLYVFFHEAGLISYTADGVERWRLDLGSFRNFYGIASSPILAKGLVLQLCDQAEGSFLVAVDQATGRERWRRNRPARVESFTTPILYPNAEDPSTVVVFGSHWLDAYDLATGENAWTLKGVASVPISSPVLAGDRLFVNGTDQADGGWPPFAGLLTEHDKDKNGQLAQAELKGSWMFAHFDWLDTDADGALTAKDWQHLAQELEHDNWGVHAIQLPSADHEARIEWSYQQNVPYIPSPLVYKDVLYLVKDGILTSLDPKTGELLKRGRLEGGKGTTYASPVAADGKIYIATQAGKLLVLEADAQWTVLKSNDLGEKIWATPAIDNGHLYVRTENRLYDFSAAGSAEAKP